MYKLINLNDVKLKTIATSKELVALWTRLDDDEFKYKDIVIVDDNNSIRAGKARAFDHAKKLGFTI